MKIDGIASIGIVVFAAVLGCKPRVEKSASVESQDSYNMQLVTNGRCESDDTQKLESFRETDEKQYNLQRCSFEKLNLMGATVKSEYFYLYNSVKINNSNFDYSWNTIASDKDGEFIANTTPTSIWTRQLKAFGETTVSDESPNRYGLGRTIMLSNVNDQPEVFTSFMESQFQVTSLSGGGYTQKIPLHGFFTRNVYNAQRGDDGWTEFSPLTAAKNAESPQNNIFRFDRDMIAYKNVNNGIEVFAFAFGGQKAGYNIVRQAYSEGFAPRFMMSTKQTGYLVFPSGLADEYSTFRPVHFYQSVLPDGRFSGWYFTEDLPSPAKTNQATGTQDYFEQTYYCTAKIPDSAFTTFAFVGKYKISGQYYVLLRNAVPQKDSAVLRRREGVMKMIPYFDLSWVEKVVGNLNELNVGSCIPNIYPY